MGVSRVCIVALNLLSVLQSEMEVDLLRPQHLTLREERLILLHGFSSSWHGKHGPSTQFLGRQKGGKAHGPDAFPIIKGQEADSRKNQESI